MSKKLIGAICCSIMIISGGICSLGYVLGNSADPWWLVVFAGGIACAIAAMAGGISNEADKNKKSQKIIGCICASISMISVLVFLSVMMLSNFANSWIIVMIGGIASAVIYIIYNAIKKDK
jgi:hypothetical protein